MKQLTCIYICVSAFFLMLVLFTGCTTDADDDGVRGSLVSLRTAGNEVNGITCQVSSSNSSSFIKLQLNVDSASFIMDNEYRFESNGDGSYSVWLYTDVEFDNFSKSEAKALCKELLKSTMNHEEKMECDENGGHIEVLLVQKTFELSDGILKDLVSKCDEEVDAFIEDSSSFHGEYTGDENEKMNPVEAEPEVPLYTVIESGKDYSTHPCNSSNESEMIFVQDSGIAFVCNENEWIPLTGDNSSKLDSSGNTVISDIDNGYTWNDNDTLYIRRNDTFQINDSFELPLSCAVIGGVSSITFVVSYQEWSYTSMVMLVGSQGHMEDSFEGNYGDYAERVCAADKKDAEDEIIQCNGSKITVDGDWDESLSLMDIKDVYESACEYLIDGLITFEDIIE